MNVPQNSQGMAAPAVAMRAKLDLASFYHLLQTAYAGRIWCRRDGATANTEWRDIAINDLTLDSRNIRPGDIFVALGGTKQHGLQFLSQADAAGAAAILADAETLDAIVLGAGLRDEKNHEVTAQLAQISTPILLLPRLKQQIGNIASHFYGEPSRAMQLVGVTGTDGKTSTSYLIAAALQGMRGSCGLIGTLGMGRPGELAASASTTPDALSLHACLAELYAAGTRYAAMEVSSHGLAQGRVDGAQFAVALLTNLGRDHLDYHGTLANYHKQKVAFLHTPKLRTAIVNLDDDEIRARLPALRALPLLCYSCNPAYHEDADVLAEEIHQRADGLALSLRITGAQNPTESGTERHPDCRLTLRSPLLGRFNASNLLAAFTALLALGLPAPAIAQQLGTLAPAPGRAERIDRPDGVTAVVDYAHTPQAVETILRDLRRHCSGRLWCVFGCGGDRDRGKRAPMGRAAEDCADQLLVTDDNPRHESGDVIVADILAGMQHPERAQVVRSRPTAIRHALDQAECGDWVAILGKGHEDYQIVGDRRLPMCDRSIVAAHVAKSSAATCAATTPIAGATCA